MPLDGHQYSQVAGPVRLDHLKRHLSTSEGPRRALNGIIRTVEVRNYPDEDDIHKARTEDPKDNSWLWWEFFIDNRSAGKREIKLFVEILDKNGQVVKSGDRSSSIDAHETDTVRLSTRLRTLDIVDSPKVRIRAEIRPK